MVKRKTATFEEFEGKIVDVRVEESNNVKIEGKQIHIEIEPLNPDLIKQGTTGRFHEWIKIPATATETEVPEGSVIDRYIQEIEMLHSEAKNKDTYLEVFEMIKDGEYLFKKKKLGKAFDGHDAHEYWTPVKEV